MESIGYSVLVFGPPGARREAPVHLWEHLNFLLTQ